MFLRNCWYVAANPGEFAEARQVVRRILGEPVLLFRDEEGRYVAFQDRCPHRLVPLSMGKRVGDTIQCGYHGMVFGTDGRCTHIPGQDKIPDTAWVKTYPVELRHAQIWIWMGDPALADAELIPHVPWPAQEGWAVASGYTHFAADYRLLSDNLLDLSHENYIHEKTIGNDAEETISDFPVKVTVEDHRVVRAHREMPDIDPPPFFRLMLRSNGRIDRWQTAIWTAPSVNLTDVGAYPVGTPRAQAYQSRVLHLLTPETETSTHYFWSQSRNFRIDEPDLTAGIREALRNTFDEDKEMLELQQREILEEGGNLPKVAIAVDDAPLRARRLLSTLVRREQDEAQPVIAPQQTLVEEASEVIAA